MDPTFFTRGLVIGFTVATADASYGAVAAFGLTAVTAVLVGARMALGVAGGAFLIWLGARTIVDRAVATEAAAAAGSDRPGLPAAWLSIYGLTMTNPMTILSFAAIFAGFGLAGGSLLEAALLTIGVFVGSSLWWIALTSVVGRLRTRLTPAVLVSINRASGVALLVFGVLAIAAAAGVGP
jgi:threonine/homoserine/homoserine lactone efflux protein